MKVCAKYSDFVNVLFAELASEFPKYTKIHNHAIELVNS